MSADERDAIAREAPTDDREARFSEWMRSAQDGDTDAYRRQLDALQPMIRRIVRLKIHDEAATEDVVQNTFLSIHRGHRIYRPERSFGPWMRAIFRNSIVDDLEAVTQAIHLRQAYAVVLAVWAAVLGLVLWSQQSPMGAASLFADGVHLTSFVGLILGATLSALAAGRPGRDQLENASLALALRGIYPAGVVLRRLGE